MATISRYAAPIVIGLAIVIRLACLAAGDRAIDDDEAISFLAATGHQAAYARAAEAKAPPFDVWTTAADLRRYMDPDPAHGLGAVRDGLAERDIHPPLYFWALHAVAGIAGSSIRAGLMLNLLFDLAAAALLFRFATAALEDRRRAALAVALWLASPAVLATFGLVRQYSLLGLAAIALAYGCQLLVGGRSRVGVAAVLVGASLAAGLLTHYLFVALGAGFVGVTWFYLRGRGDRRVALLVASGIGSAVAAVANPRAFLGFNRIDEIRQPFSAGEIPHRLIQAAKALLGFVAPNTTAARAVAAFAVLGMLAFAIWERRRARANPRPVPVPVEAAFLAWSALVFIAPYVLQKTPEHAMGDRYGAALWPFLAALIVTPFGAPRVQRLLSACCLALVTVGALGWSAKYVSRTRRARPSRTDAAIVDSDWRGALLPIVWRLGQNVSVLAANPADLTALPASTFDRPGRWAYFAASTPATAGAGDIAAARRRVEAGRCETATADEAVVESTPGPCPR